MIVELNNVKLMFRWKHILPQQEKKKLNVIIPARNGSTSCECYTMIDGVKSFFRGVTVTCNNNDLFSKESGRIESLSKLLNLDRTELMVSKRFKIELANGKPYWITAEIPSGKFNDNGLFKRKDREEIWNEYWLSKEASPKDLEAELNKLIAETDPKLVRIAQLCELLSLEPEERLEFLTNSDNDE